MKPCQLPLACHLALPILVAAGTSISFPLRTS
jgi:hypothetical protein